MSFFRRNKDAPLIPPVPPPAQAESKPDPYAAPTRGGGGGGGDPYARSKPAAGGGDPYARSKPAAGDDNPYALQSRPPADAARDELFAGFKAPAKPVGERKYGYEGREDEEDFDPDEEVEGIKQEMRGIKQDSLASTR